MSRIYTQIVYSDSLQAPKVRVSRENNLDT